MNVYANMALLAGLLAAVTGSVYFVGQRFDLHAELRRKLLHVGMGLVILSLPWLFATSWPVLVLVALAIIGLVIVRSSKSLKSGVGGILHDVGRRSLGEIYFPISAAILFYVSKGDPILFCVPMLVLTLADALSAIIGIRYGATKYETAEGQKSIEGSVVFFTITFLSVHIPILLFTDTGRAESLLIAITMGLIVMLIEAVSWDGLDNLFIPLGAYLLLETYLTMDVYSLSIRTALMFALIGFVFICRRSTTLNSSGLIAAALFGYVSWALGGLAWFIPGLILFICYPLLSPKTEVNIRRVHNVHAVVSVTAGSTIWLFLTYSLEIPDLLFPFVISFAGHLAIIGVARLRHDRPEMSGLALLLRCGLVAWAIMIVPFVLLQFEESRVMITSVGLVGVFIAATGFYFLQPELRQCPRDTPRWLRQGTLAFAGSLIGLIPM